MFYPEAPASGLHEGPAYKLMSSKLRVALLEVLVSS